jgi:hypothetical protein
VVAIYKSIRSANPNTGKRELLDIIQSPNLTGVAIYTKGKLMVFDGLGIKKCFPTPSQNFPNREKAMETDMKDITYHLRAGGTNIK